MMLSELLDQVISLPLELEGAFRPPASERSLRDAESRCLLRLPEELKTMLRRFNGTTSCTNVDHGWLTFWSAEDLNLASIETRYKERTDLIVFADHGLSAWFYAIEGAREDGVSSPVYVIIDDPEIVSLSLTEFLRAVIAGDTAS